MRHIRNFSRRPSAVWNIWHLYVFEEVIDTDEQNDNDESAEKPVHHVIVQLPIEGAANGGSDHSKYDHADQKDPGKIRN